MSYNGSQFYNNSANLEKYLERRSTLDNANDTLEKPVICELIGDVSGSRILDIGCGDGKFALELFDAGCDEYVGIDGAETMFQLAVSTVNGYNATIVHTTIEHWTYPAAAFDLVLSRLAVHYVEDISSLFRQIHQSLIPGGRFIFSIEHPVITSTLQPTGMRMDWVVDHYFSEGYREQHWLGGIVHKFHRPIEAYYRALQEAGFTIDHLRESAPQRQHFACEETYQRRLRIPLFLILGAKKE
ncbi:class I SAM-dependent methyltransferase [Paenibacillus sp. GCM10027626]|uniref:class I SAM-dependent methyltransferase n=1 Tax=Paenibacillus sp. GCM10027626 TaxID=3273411 RepID=UPI0036348A1D